MQGRIYLIVFSLSIVMTLGILGYSKEAFPDPVEGEDIILSEHFDQIQNRQAAGSQGGGVELHDVAVTPSDKGGQALQLNAGTYATINPPKGISAKAGTISFWTKPLWGEDTGSHVFLSMPWADGKKGYMAISYGWWEPQGSGRLYFIASNQEFISCALPYKLDSDAWVMITAVWKSGSDGFCKVFVNDKKVAELTRSFSGEYTNAGPLYLGSDKGATDQRGRSAVALMDDLMVFNRPLSTEEILKLYRSDEKGLLRASAGKWKWLDQGLAIPLERKRNGQGKLLESRVIFDEDMHWAFSKKAADDILTKVKAAGFNVYIPCVWHGNGTYYPTSLAPMDPKLASIIPGGYDPLAYLIQKAHSMGIEIHPWFTVALKQGTLFPKFYGEGVPQDAYDVHKPEFRKFITDLMLDVVQRYDADGINLDYIRTVGICTSDDCQKDYLEKTGNNFKLDYALRGVLGPARDRIERWQDDAVTDIVQNFVSTAKKTKPRLIISVDGHPKPPDEKRALEGRDELRWANEGLIDVIFDMDYKERIDFETVDRLRKALKQPEKVIVMFGNYDKPDEKSSVIPRPGELVAKYAAFAQHKWPNNGVGLYIYSMLNNEQVIALKKGPFAEDALPRWRG